MSNEEKLLELARARFGELTKAEVTLFRAAASGLPAILSAKNERDNDPANAANWGDERVLEANRIRWLCTDRQPMEFVTCIGLWIEGARIGGVLDLSGAAVPFLLLLLKCAFAEVISLSHAQATVLNLGGSHTGGIIADGLTLNRSLFLHEGFLANGEVRLPGASIGGDLDCSNGRFLNPKGCALNVERARVQGTVFLRKGFHAEGEVRIRNAEIGGLDCIEGNFNLVSEKACALDICETKIARSVYLRESQVSGEVKLIGAAINGDLDCRSAKISNPDKQALNADRLSVKGSVFLRDDLQVKGETRLLNAFIGGGLDCSGSHFANSTGVALALDGSTIDYGVSLTEGFRAEGNVRMLGVSIHGDLACVNGVFVNSEDDAICAEGLSIKGNFLCRKGFVAKGKVNLVGMKVSGGFQWRGFQSAEGSELDLRFAEVGTLWDSKSSWPGQGKLHLHGFKYSEISEKAPSDAKSRIDWLRRQPDGQFLPQPYEQLAAVLRKSGSDEEAKKILIEKNKDHEHLRLLRNTSLRKWLWHRFLGRTIGYGYRPMRAFWIRLFLIMFGTVLFEAGCYFNTMMPTKQVISVTHETDSGLVVFDEYPRFISFVYSVDTFVPLVDLHQASYFLPNASGGFGLFLTIYMYVHIAFGWIITTLLVVSMTGLLKK